MPPNYNLALGTGVSASQGASLSVYISHHLVSGRFALHTLTDLFAFYFSSGRPPPALSPENFKEILLHFGFFRPCSLTFWHCISLVL